MPKKLPSLVGRFDKALTATDHARETINPSVRN